MNLPVIPTPIFPRWIWMEEVTYSHIPIATFITAAMVLAPIFEYIGYRRKDLRFDRLAKSLIWFSLILFSPGAALGTGIPMIIIGLYPEFWSRWVALFFWPLVGQFVFFTLEVVFLFLLYYLSWDRMMNRKRLHIFYGCLAALFGLMVQIIWDSLGAYMMTPNVPFPMISEPVAWSVQSFFNPSFPWLFSHRFFGNISYVMMLVGGIFALRYMKNKNPVEKAYFGFVTDTTFTIGILAFFTMPFIGWGYARTLQEHAPVAFHAIMGGHSADKFFFKLMMIVIFLTIAGTYLFIRHRKKTIMLSIVSVALASLYLIIIWHPAIGWFGSSGAWRAITTVGTFGFIGYLWFMNRKTSLEVSTHGWPWFLFVAGLAAFFTFAIGGFVRERAKSPYTVTDALVKPEVLDYEADRYLFYQKCVGCHHQNPKDITGMTNMNWRDAVTAERERPGVQLTDEEAEQIIRYLEEHHQ